MQKSTLQIDGMTCDHCVDSVTKIVEAFEGVSAVQVSLEAKNAQIEYDATRVSLADIEEAIIEDGFEVKAQS